MICHTEWIRNLTPTIWDFSLRLETVTRMHKNPPLAHTICSWKHKILLLIYWRWVLQFFKKFCLQYPLTMLQLFLGDIYSLLNFMSFLRWLSIGVVVLGLIYLRYTRPDLPRPFKVSIDTLLSSQPHLIQAVVPSSSSKAANITKTYQCWLLAPSL